MSHNIRNPMKWIKKWKSDLKLISEKMRKNWRKCFPQNKARERENSCSLSFKKRRLSDCMRWRLKYPPIYCRITGIRSASLRGKDWKLPKLHESGLKDFKRMKGCYQFTSFSSPEIILEWLTFPWISVFRLSSILASAFTSIGLLANTVIISLKSVLFSR